MENQAQLEREARGGRWAASAAFASAALLVASLVYSNVQLSDRAKGDNGLLKAVDARAGDVIASAVAQGVAFVLLAIALAYLYRATKARRPELPRITLALAVAAPVAFALLLIATQLELVRVAHDFVAIDGASGPGAKGRAEALIEESALRRITDVGLGTRVALGFAFVLLAHGAMRAGLLGRFIGVLGIIVGVLYVVPFLARPDVIQAFWLGALGALFLDRWPGGRGPAWQTGEATPWPTNARARPEPLAGETGGDVVPAAGAEARAKPRRKRRR